MTGCSPLLLALTQRQNCPARVVFRVTLKSNMVLPALTWYLTSAGSSMAVASVLSAVTARHFAP